jgi:hypothetical protein
MNPYYATLCRKWAKVLDGVPSDSMACNLAQLLENEEKYFNMILNEGAIGTMSSPQNLGIPTSTLGGGSESEVGVDGDGVKRGIARYKQLAIPMVRRIFPELLANQLVGVQPMNQAVSIAYALRYRASTEGKGYDLNTELGYNNINPAYTSAASAYNGYSTLQGEQLNETGHFGLASGESGDITSEVGLTVEQREVVARTRKLKARWTIEAQQDLAMMQNVDLEEQMINLMTYEIAAQIDRELVGRIIACAKAGGVLSWDYGSVGIPQSSGTGADGRWEQEKFRTLYTVFLNAAEEIARATRMGSGNYVIVSPKVSVALQTLTEFKNRSDVSLVGGANIDALATGISKIGTIGPLTVYRDTHASSNYAVVGYKGQREDNTGIIYCPYIPVQFAKATGEESFSPRAGVMTRYGILDHLFGSQNYYRFIEISNLNNAVATSQVASGFTATNGFYNSAANLDDVASGYMIGS